MSENPAIHYCQNSVSEEALNAFIRRFANEITPPLSARVDIDAYAKKLKRFGTTWEAFSESGELLGVLVAYTNDLESRNAFISYFRVMTARRGEGIGRKLFENLSSYCKNCRMKTIALEVDKDNVGALRFYRKNGFVVGAEKETSFLMQMELC